MPKLTISGTTHELVENTITIGRSPDNLIHLDDPSVSSKHAELRVAGENHELRDIGSTNGTLVNGVTVTQTNLRPGDRIRFGAVDGCYECDPAVQPLPAAQPVEALPAAVSARPVDFANASPFGARKTTRDPIRTTVLATAAVALLAWLGSMVAVLLLQAPNQ